MYTTTRRDLTTNTVYLCEQVPAARLGSGAVIFVDGMAREVVCVIELDGPHVAVVTTDREEFEFQGSTMVNSILSTLAPAGSAVGQGC